MDGNLSPPLNPVVSWAHSLSSGQNFRLIAPAVRLFGPGRGYGVRQIWSGGRLCGVVGGA